MYERTLSLSWRPESERLLSFILLKSTLFQCTNRFGVGERDIGKLVDEEDVDLSACDNVYVLYSNSEGEEEAGIFSSTSLILASLLRESILIFKGNGIVI